MKVSPHLAKSASLPCGQSGFLFSKSVGIYTVAGSQVALAPPVAPPAAPLAAAVHVPKSSVGAAFVRVSVAVTHSKHISAPSVVGATDVAATSGIPLQSVHPVAHTQVSTGVAVPLFARSSRQP